jgi:hypothetical protein
MLFPLLVHVFKILNPNAASEKTPRCTLESTKKTSLYDIMENIKEMVLFMIKEQQAHFRIMKLNEEECKDLLAWRDREVQFFYVKFVTRQILGIVELQLETRSLQHCRYLHKPSTLPFGDKKY